MIDGRGGQIERPVLVRQLRHRPRPELIGVDPGGHLPVVLDGEKDHDHPDGGHDQRKRPRQLGDVALTDGEPSKSEKLPKPAAMRENPWRIDSTRSLSSVSRVRTQVR